MLLLLSPAKALDFDTPPITADYTQPQFLAQAQILIDTLRPKSPAEIAELMHLSDKLALLNVERYHHWNPPFTPQNAKQAVLAFNGDVYDGLNASSLSKDSLAWVQKHVRILSGLYGVLRPLDLIQPYRLEMGTRLATATAADLYGFWRKTITNQLLCELKNSSDRVVINCASTEYSKSVDFKSLKARVITPIFKDGKNGEYKIISFYAKQARGSFARFASTSGNTDINALKDFDLNGYQFNREQSTSDTWVFLREERQSNV